MYQVIFLARVLNILWNPVRALQQRDHSESQVWRERKTRGEWITVDQSFCLFCVFFLFLFFLAAAVSSFMQAPPPRHCDCREWRLRSERFLSLDHLRHICGRGSAAARALMQPLNQRRTEERRQIYPRARTHTIARTNIPLICQVTDAPMLTRALTHTPFPAVTLALTHTLSACHRLCVTPVGY